VATEGIPSHGILTTLGNSKNFMNRQATCCFKNICKTFKWGGNLLMPRNSKSGPLKAGAE